MNKVFRTLKGFKDSLTGAPQRRISQMGGEVQKKIDGYHPWAARFHRWIPGSQYASDVSKVKRLEQMHGKANKNTLRNYMGTGFTIGAAVGGYKGAKALTKQSAFINPAIIKNVGLGAALGGSGAGLGYMASPHAPEDNFYSNLAKYIAVGAAAGGGVGLFTHKLHKIIAPKYEIISKKIMNSNLV